MEVNGAAERSNAFSLAVVNQWWYGICSVWCQGNALGRAYNNNGRRRQHCNRSVLSRSTDQNDSRVTYLGAGLVPPRDDIAVDVVRLVPDLRQEDGGDCVGRREEPDERQVDGVGPRPRHGAALAGKVPLAVLHEEVEGEEEQREGEEGEEAVVEEAVRDAVLWIEGSLVKFC